MTEVDDYTTTEGKVENGNVTITNTHVPVIPEEPEDPKTTDVTFSKVEVNGSAELPGASLKVVSGETADGQIATDAKTGENLAWTSGDTGYSQSVQLVRGRLHYGGKSSASRL
ncbi:hypothetical protein Si067_00189 [Streptococcus infantarius subsp. infantarius]|nr:hypothetical protein [Streptococcus infantarius subsp. infantarius]